MYFHFTDEQREFGDAMCSYFMNEATPELERKLWDTPTGRSPEMWTRMAEHGLTGLSVPEQFGGLGKHDDDWLLMTQVIGYYGGSDGLFETAWIAAGMLAALPAESAARSRWLPRIASGEARIAVGHEIHALTPDQIRIAPRRSIDPSRRLFTVEWTPSAATRIATAETGRRLWAEALNRGALCVAGQMNGLAQHIIDLSVDYTAQRKQFGKAIGSFQAVKHQLADVAIKLEFAKPVAYRAAYALTHGQRQHAVHISHAKLCATGAARRACRNGIQVHGAIGYTWEMDLQIFAKRVWALDATWGDEAFHKSRVADFIFDAATHIGPGETFPD
jgi:alkylation response protein AidB-like acyl-CoA dehydrogenase